MLRVFEAFAGIGTQRMALRNLGIEHEVVAISEIDKFAIKSYEAIHGQTRNLGDIAKINIEDIPDHDLFTYSFPYQDISLAGKMQGLEKDSETRSSLLWECERIIESKKPKYLLMENVKNLVGKKFKPYFEEWLKVLENLGYSNYWEVLNAKDYGIPQNRERVFCVSILNSAKPFVFPEPIKLPIKLKDLLESKVDEKFYLSQEQVAKIKFSNFEQKKSQIQKKDWCDTLCARDFKDPKCVEVENKPKMIGGIGEKNFGNSFRQGNRIYDSNGVATCLTASPTGNAGGYTTLYAVDKENDTVEPTRLGGIFDTNKKHQAGSIWDKEGLAPTLDTMQGGWRQPSVTEEPLNTKKFRVRRLTPKECWRLMGIADEDYEKASKVVSNTQLYKQAGNAIVVNVLEGIFSNMPFSSTKMESLGKAHTKE